jgi:hypothetical protein
MPKMPKVPKIVGRLRRINFNVRKLSQFILRLFEGKIKTGFAAMFQFYIRGWQMQFKEV